MTCKIPQRFKQNIRVIRLSHYEAKGPIYARALIEQHLLQDELYFLQLDSHMLMVQHWDELCISQLLQCKSDRAILTTYPHNFDRLTRRFVILANGQKKPFGSVPPTFLRFREFHKRLRFSEQERNTFAITPYKPQPSLFIASGFLFTLTDCIHQVPNDPNCPYIFLGEEMSMGLRYYTYGWDFYAPGINICYHLLKRDYRPTFWEQLHKQKCVVDDATRKDRKLLEDQSVRRIRLLLYGKLQDDKYGVGDVRTIQEWEQYTGIDIQNQIAQPRSFHGLTPDADKDEIYFKMPKVNQLQISRQQISRQPIGHQQINRQNPKLKRKMN